MATATKTWYAWTDIVYRKNETKKVARAGEIVTAEMLGLDEGRWGVLINTRAVRPDEYPPIDRSTSNILSPIQFYREQARRAEQVELDNVDSRLYAVLPPDDALEMES